MPYGSDGDNTWMKPLLEFRSIASVDDYGNAFVIEQDISVAVSFI